MTSVPMPLPVLHCPFGSEISPHADEVDRHTTEWASACGLLANPADESRYREARVGRLAARTSPGATVEALSLLADWQMWLFVFDDRCCDESETGTHPERLSQVIAGLIPVLDGAAGGAHQAGPFATALADLIRRITLAASGPQLCRFLSAVRGYFLAQFWEAAHRAAGQPAGLAEYQAMRRHSGAVPTCVALMDVAGGFELPEGEFCRPDVRAVTDIAVNVTCWANDILSYPKEAARSLKVHSLPAVLVRERGLSPAGAIAAAAAMHDAEVARYLRSEEPVRRRASPELRRYLDGLRAWMSGNFYWSLETGRYALAAG
jgi:hypothetical protein